MVVDVYAIESYPNADFQNEPKTQGVVTLRRKNIDRWLMLGFVTWVAVFFASLLLGVVGLPALTLAGLGLLLVLFILLAIFGIFDPALHCPHCGRPLKEDWAVLESGGSGKFLICSNCHIYVYTHRTMR